MPASSGTDNILSGILGALQGFQAARQPYEQNRVALNQYQQQLELQNQSQLNLFRQELPLKQQSAIEEERQKGLRIGSSFDPQTIKTLGLDPNSMYDVNVIDKELQTKMMQQHLQAQENMFGARMNQQQNLQNQRLDATIPARANLAYQNYQGNHPFTSHLPWSPSQSDFMGGGLPISSQQTQPQSVVPTVGGQFGGSKVLKVIKIK